MNLSSTHLWIGGVASAVLIGFRLYLWRRHLRHDRRLRYAIGKEAARVLGNVRDATMLLTQAPIGVDISGANKVTWTAVVDELTARLRPLVKAIEWRSANRNALVFLKADSTQLIDEAIDKGSDLSRLLESALSQLQEHKQLAFSTDTYTDIRGAAATCKQACDAALARLPC